MAKKVTCVIFALIRVKSTFFFQDLYQLQGRKYNMICETNLKYPEKKGKKKRLKISKNDKEKNYKGNE